MKSFVKKVPLLYTVAKWIRFSLLAPLWRFPGSEEYWKQRYARGGNSGAGSYEHLAEFKAEVLNAFVIEHEIQTVIEFGCGDGNQLRLANYPSYTGYDVSDDALELCRSMFSGQENRRFRRVSEHGGERAELSLSLDVIYHLVEDTVFDEYMQRLFDSATRFVIVYSSNSDEQARLQAAHVRHRHFTRWVERHRPEWECWRRLRNRYAESKNEQDASFADFFFFRRREAP